MGAQFLTAVGAFLGTVIGIAIQELGRSTAATSSSNSSQMTGRTSGLLGTSLHWGDMLLPFTAGTFLYVGTVAVIPELLETKNERKGKELGQMMLQFVAMATGAGIMLA